MLVGAVIHVRYEEDSLCYAAYIVQFMPEMQRHRIVYDRSELFMVEDVNLYDGTTVWHHAINPQEMVRQYYPNSPYALLGRILEVYPRNSERFTGLVLEHIPTMHTQGTDGFNCACLNAPNRYRVIDVDSTYFYAINLDTTNYEILL